MKNTYKNLYIAQNTLNLYFEFEYVIVKKLRKYTYIFLEKYDEMTERYFRFNLKYG